MSNIPPVLPHDRKPRISKMTITNLNATTPQLKALKNLLEGYLSLDIKNVEPFISNDFQIQTFPKIDGLPDEAKGRHFERYGVLLSLMKRIEVGVRHRLQARRLMHLLPLGHHQRYDRSTGKGCHPRSSPHLDLSTSSEAHRNAQPQMQLSAVCHTADDDKLEYDSLSIITLVEENGEPKVADVKDFSDPEKRGRIHGWVAKKVEEINKTACA